MKKLLIPSIILIAIVLSIMIWSAVTAPPSADRIAAYRQQGLISEPPTDYNMLTLTGRGVYTITDSSGHTFTVTGPLKIEHNFLPGPLISTITPESK